MNPAPTGRTDRCAHRSEHGYIAATTGIMMALLLGCVAIAVDAAIWFARADQLQKTADAASLAGVTKMPDFAAAKAAAIEIATKNRLDASNVVVNTVPDSPRQIVVEIKDPKVKSFFGKAIGQGDIGIQRKSKAEFVQKIELGSTLNAIGTGQLAGWGPNGSTQNFWLAINGGCTSKEDGDRFASKYEGNRRTNGDIWCSDYQSLFNTEYRTEDVTAGPTALIEPSYTYIVTVPCPSGNVNPCPDAVDFRIDAFDPTFDRSNLPNTIDTNVVDPTVKPDIFDQATFDTTFTLRNDDNSPVAYLNPATGLSAPIPVASFGTCENCQATDWTNLFTITRAGRYRVGINTVGTTYAYGSNAFALRVTENIPGRFGLPCQVAGCPTISGESA